MFLEARFNGTNRYVDGELPVTPFRLSACSHHVFNWDSIEERLPAGWDEEEYHIEGIPYAWCETLLDACDCHGSKGRLDAAYCSDFGLHDEVAKRKRKSENVRYLNYIQDFEKRIAASDESQRQQRVQREQRTTPQPAAPVAAKVEERGGVDSGKRRPLVDAINKVNRLVAGGFYCSIEGRHHAYGQQAILKTVASLSTAFAQISTWDRPGRQLAVLGNIGAHWLQVHQSEECAQRPVWGDVEIPDVLYKYIPKERIGKGAPNSLRATQLLTLNDDMECNVVTMKGSQQEDTLAFLADVQSKMKEHLGIEVPWEDLLLRSIRFGDLRLSAFIQEYLNSRVGVVSFSTDILVPTMWAHYARNTGIVVGYETDALRALGYELRPVVYSELAPMYRPSAGDTIGLDFVNREEMERDLRAGRDREGLPILASTQLAQFGTGWKSLSRLLLVKGISWSYEKEVRLLVDLEQTRDTGKKDINGWPVKVMDPPPEAIKEIYGGANTRDADIERAVRAGRGENKSGLFVGHVSSHAFRIQKTGGTNH